MPELPELELLQGVLSKHLVGKTIVDVAVDPRRQVVLRYPPADFARDMRGRAFASVARRGKFLRFDFAEHADAMIVNPMLGGRFALASRAAPPLPATCFVLQLSGAVDLRFLDTTLMARVYLTDRPDADVPGWSELGPDALDPSFTSGFLKIHGKGKTVCPRCGHRVSVIHSGGEATYFCRGCQL